MKDYYRILGLDPLAEPEVVAAAYKALLGKYQDSREAGTEGRLNDIIEAYGVLGDSVKRAGYDRECQSALEALSSPGGGRPSGYPRKNTFGYDEHENSLDNAVMILIPPGEFLMGSPVGEGYGEEHPQRNIYLDPFYIYKYEVTNGQFARFVNETGYKAKGDWEKYAVQGRESHPVINVTWTDAQAYCQWAGGDLPTEAQWEKAARGIDGRRFPWGDHWDRNKCNNVDTDSSEYRALRAHLYLRRGTTPVGAFSEGASPYGCMDMAGNVWEWCGDWYDQQYYQKSPVRNPPGPLQGDARVYRGGAWNNDATTGFRCAYRTGSPPGETNFLFGFRPMLLLSGE
ncbi:MAG: SUMF1/EgtB/PvdO family nonheme iron enzyme [Candidatus Eremiobacteraeota bacterium]|nr:SUMF1/EgtB/PvdO family nonheme iron enzyme [Candidatus Eremiobacteraeota bacterium]